MSSFNEWDPARYVPDAFANFTASSNLDLGTARALMWVAQLAYELDVVTSPQSVDKVKGILKKWDMQFVDAISVPGFPSDVVSKLPLLSIITRDALVISGRDALIVAFAGTDPPRPQDLIADLNILPSSGGVSQGLHDAAVQFAPRIKALRDQNNGLRLFVTGHSLGGSLGVALADALHPMGCDPDAIYTYGMPRAGDPAFAARYNATLGGRTFRFVHGDDFVATVPPAGGFLPHQHVGFLIQCETGGKFAPSQRSADTGTNEPMRDRDIPFGLIAPAGSIDRGLTALGVLLHGGGFVDAAIANLPPRLRHHLQDQYIAALTS
jgi:lipase (class 3)